MGKRYIHREICAKAHGKFPSNFHVHHIDGNHKNNDPTNLIAISKELHARIHRYPKDQLPNREQLILSMECYKKAIEKWNSLKTELAQLDQRKKRARIELIKLERTWPGI